MGREEDARVIKVQLKTLKQEGLPALMKLSEAQAKKMLIKMDVLPASLELLACWGCGEPMKKTSSTALRYNRFKCNKKISRADLA